MTKKQEKGLYVVYIRESLRSTTMVRDILNISTRSYDESAGG